MAPTDPILLLIDKVVAGAATVEEYSLLISAMENAIENDPTGSITDQITAHLAAKTAGAYDNQYDVAFWDQLGKAILAADRPALPEAPRVHRIHFLKTSWFKYAAAILLMIAGIAVYYSVTNTSATENQMVQNIPSAKQPDVSPGFNRAVLTLSDGQKILLDSAASEIITDGTLSIKNIDGQLVYASGGTLATALPGEPAGRQAGEERASGSMVALNTMTTPKGGQYQLTLADGTKVWLNAASSITYPTTFTNKTREVSITGEAYFEVAKNTAKPFIVKTPQEDITVLGTQFNVNAYADEPAMKTSLVEGAVKVGAKLLRPGQAYVDGRVMHTNIEQDIAWKQGYFYMQGADIKTVMRSIIRWYDVDVKYKGNISSTFRVQISRNTPLSDVLKILEATGKVKPVINGKTVIIQ
jgi:hypothetical protein